MGYFLNYFAIIQWNKYDFHSIVFAKGPWNIFSSKYPSKFNRILRTTDNNLKVKRIVLWKTTLYGARKFYPGIWPKISRINPTLLSKFSEATQPCLKFRWVSNPVPSAQRAKISTLSILNRRIKKASQKMGNYRNCMEQGTMVNVFPTI